MKDFKMSDLRYTSVGLIVVSALLSVYKMWPETFYLLSIALIVAVLSFHKEK
jgi:hypothetical protein